MALEVWVEAPGFPAYQISSLGRVRRWKVQKPSLERGYHRVRLQRDGVQHTVRVHRLVCEAFNGPAPMAGMVVEHIDHNKANNTPENLRWTTQAENMARSVEADIHARKERSGAAILTEAAVREIRRTPKHIQSSRELAARFGVSRKTVEGIRAGRSWSGVK